jgi:hypothetical protein
MSVSTLNRNQELSGQEVNLQKSKKKIKRIDQCSRGRGKSFEFLPTTNRISNNSQWR